MEEARLELAHRPLVLAALALCVGLTALLHPLHLLFLLPLLWFRRPLPVALALVLGLTLAPRPVPLLNAPYWANGEARVLSVPSAAPDALVADVEIGGRRLRAVFPLETPMSRGDVWRLQGRVTPLSEASESIRTKGIEGSLRPAALRKLADGPWPWRAADAWRRSYDAFARRTLRPDQARWLSAFAFRIQGLEEEEIDALKETGTVHLIAASGLHVAALGLLGMGIGSALGAPRVVVLAGMFVLIAFYAMATGLHLPTLRAALAFAVGSSAYLFRREPDGLSALALAVLVYLPFDPAEVYGLGFQLSTTVVGMLVLWPHRWNDEPVRTAAAWFAFHVRDLALVSVVAALAAEPIIARHEGRIALLTVPANFVAVPPAMVAILLTLVFHPLGLSGAMPFVGGLVSVAKAAIEGAGRVPDLSVAPFSPYLLLFVYLPWIWFWRPRARPCS